MARQRRLGCLSSIVPVGVTVEDMSASTSRFHRDAARVNDAGPNPFRRRSAGVKVDEVKTDTEAGTPG